ncbi:hypothetical protein BU26DRAFT_569442 [Trematosphaeria pertusa]|uniref:EthD domain-containing protein n=1 Tax=Trematosphaeria pertusa TaxID=390896 RepID=A0A6A6I4C6_9PLEO|nr:uncharacterized protein BU26DRAFT_569442 [Trematosphaeria pertusa]KAF2244460.1 hypothetical protein BU26DRAFT_569442 [Trematosphaeria pertusa]
MTYSLILFVPCKPGLTLEAFKHHWETSHIPLLKSLVGYDFPLSHTRHYIERTLDGQANVSVGGPQDIAFDGVAVLTFADRGHYERFLAKVNEDKAQQKHAEDLEKFVDVGALKGVMVGLTRATGRDGGDVGWRFVGSV